MENAFQMTSYIALPLVIIAFLALVHLLLLFIVKTRSTAKTSFILFSALALFALGAIYSLYLKNTFIFVCATLISQIALLPYLFILATGFKKNYGKTKLQEGQEQNRLSNISQEKFNDMFALTKDLAEAASQSISHSTDINEFLDFFASKLITATKAEGCAILLADEFENFLTVHSLLGNFPPIYKLPESVELEKEAVQEHIKNMQFQFNGNIFGEAAFSPVALLIKNASKDKRIYQNGSEDFLSCGSFIFMPLRLPNTSGAVIALSRSSNSPSFSEEELEEAKFINESLATVIMPLASFLEYNEHQELNKEGEAAIKFHRFLLQEKFPKFNTFTLGCWTQSAEYICGDYYDVSAVRKDRISFVLADVAGKGMHSFTITAMLRAMLRLALGTMQSSAKILELLNKALCKETFTQDHFASMTLINYNPLTQNAQISTCGRTSLFFYNAGSNDVSALSISSEPLGISNESSYRDIDLALHSGDILVICTDGLLESFNELGVQYSSENLVNAIHASCTLSGEKIAEHIKQDVLKYCEQTQQYDDMSLMAIKIN